MLNVLIMLVALAAIIGGVVLWIMSLYQAATRKDLQNNKWLWILLIIFVSPLGTIIYFFVENKKKLGVWSLVLFLALPLILGAYAIMTFASQNLAA